MSNYVEWRAYIGPRFLATSAAQFWDWAANLNAGGSLPNYAQTTLTADVASGATSISVASNSGWPNTGSLWIGPNVFGEGWENCPYSVKGTNTFSSLQRETLIGGAEHNGHHTSGAIVRFWWPITTDDGKLHLVEEIDDNLAVISWKCDIGGVLFPQAAIRNNHLIVIQTRNSPSGNFTNFLVGWLDEPHVTDDADKASAWTARIVSSAEMLKRQYTTGLRVGDLDLASHGNASGSVSLGSPYSERNSGDYIAAAPDFSPGAVIDDDPSTLWITERYMGDSNTPALNNDPLNPNKAYTELIFTQVYVNPPGGQSGGRRWFEMTAVGGLNAIGYELRNASSNPSVDNTWVVSPGELGMGDHILFVEDKKVFEAEHPLHNEVAMFENPNFFDMIAQSGEIGVRFGMLDRDLTNIQWGDGTRNLHTFGNFWTGPRITSPGSGETMRYIYADPPGTPTSSQYWQVSDVQSPGYDIGTTPDQWIQIEIAPIGLILRDTITPTSPGIGGILYINDASGPSTSGLDSSGQLQIGSEKINYSAKQSDGVVVSQRGASGTTAAAHQTKDLVYIVDSGVATDAAPVKQISWTRQGGSINPNNFHVYVSNLPTTARNPDGGSDYRNDYTQVAAVSGYSSASWSLTFSPTKRVKTILITVARMTANPGRVRLNAFHAYADDSKYGSNNWLPTGQTVGSIFTKLLNLGNIPSTAVTVINNTAGPASLTTAADKLWTIIADFADYTGYRVNCGRDSKFTINDDTRSFWTTASPAVDATWTEVNASVVEHIWTSQGEVSNVILKWETIDKVTTGTESYPSLHSIFGKVLELGPLVYTTQAAAQLAAKKRYFINKYPFTLHVDCADSQQSLRAGTINTLQFQIDATMPALARNFIARSVDHSIDKNVWSTAIDCIQIDREVWF